MILRKLHIENFGAFHDFELEFREGVNELSRPNEFGKTTILEFIRRIFWGFPDRRSRANLYPQLHGTGAYGGWLEVTMRSGEKLKLERRGERASLRVTGEDGKVTEGADIRILSNCSERFYNSIGAITIDELNEAAALDDEEIRTRLYGGGLNDRSIPLSKIRKELLRRAEELYTRTGSRNRLWQMAQEFAASNEKVSEAATHLELFRKALENKEEQDRLEIELRKKLETAQKKYDDLLRRNKGFEQWDGLLKEESALKKELLPQPPVEPEIPEALKLACDAGRARSVDAKALAQAEALLAKRKEFTQKLAGVSEEQFLAPPPLEPQPDGTLQTLCSAKLAAAVDQQSLDTAKAIPGKRSLLLSTWKRTRFLPVIAFLLIVFTAASLLAGCMNHITGLIIAGGVFLLAAIVLIVINKRQEKKVSQLQSELQKEVPELAMRFAMNPVLSPEKCYSALILLREYQEFHGEYERELAAWQEQEKLFLEEKKKQQELRERLQQELQKSDSELRQFHFAYSIHPETAPEKLPEVLRQLQTFQQSSAALNEERSVYEKSLSDRRRKEQKLALRREALMTEYGPVPPEPVPAEELVLAGSELSGVQDQLQQCLRESGGFNTEAEHLRDLSDSSDELNTREQIRGEMTETAREYLRFRAALLLLDRTVARGEREHQGTVLQQGSALFSDFTAGRYTKIYKSMETNDLVVIDGESGLGKRIPELSRGTKEQLLLALRLALIASFETENEPLPVILDDVLVNFDLTRREAVLQGLKKFGANRQILLLSVER